VNEHRGRDHKGVERACIQDWHFCGARDAEHKCIVPLCDVWTVEPTRHGMCPPKLWDEKHDAFYEAITGRTTTHSNQQAAGLRRSA
jgi:hypothetical protein